MVTAHEILGFIEPIQILTTLGAAVNFGQQLPLDIRSTR